MEKNGPSDPSDTRFMRMALALARRGLGRVWPNPSVGCVIVGKDGEGRVVGRGWTQPGGRPHAEAEALRHAGSHAKGATAYISLEPCIHWGETPPCALSLIEAGIARAVIAVEDPDPRVSGEGIAALRKAGVDVTLGVCAREAETLNEGYLLRAAEGRPLVTLKLGTTLDGRIATHKGESRWITGEQARKMAHGLRARFDAVMLGIGSVLADDPLLTCRLPGLEECSPVRIVVDSRLRLPLTSRLVATAREVPTWIVTRDDADSSRLDAYLECGVEVIDSGLDEEGNLDMTSALRALGMRGLTRVLVEGGANLAAALLYRGLVDHLAWFRAPRIMGGDGIPAALPFGVEALSETVDFTRLSVATVGEDILETYVRRG